LQARETMAKIPTKNNRGLSIRAAFSMFATLLLMFLGFFCDLFHYSKRISPRIRATAAIQLCKVRVL
jgi:hypothetical protein